MKLSLFSLFIDMFMLLVMLIALSHIFFGLGDEISNATVIIWIIASYFATSLKNK